MATFDNSILIETKKALGIDQTVTVFDSDIRMHINSALGTLSQLGLGPEGGYEIETSAQTWADFLLTDLTLSPAKSYVFLRVKLLFDPPPNSWTIVAMKEQIQELEWRLNASREDKIPVQTVPDVDESDDLFWYRYFRYLDGGTV